MWIQLKLIEINLECREVRRCTVYLLQYETEEDVLERVPHFIEEVYNTKRLHSSLDYLTPVEFEEKKKAKLTEPLGPIHT
jgi:transposase InsO family protein